MTESDTAGPTEATPADQSATADDPAATAADDRVDTDRVRRYLNYALLAGLSLFALVAAFQFYFNASAAINQWIAPEFRSAFQAAFNLAVLLVAAAGITRQARRLAGD